MSETLFESPSLQLTVQDKVATLRVRRPQALNALNKEVLEGICRSAAALDEQTAGGASFEKVSVLVLRGEGDRAFVAGADIKQMQEASPEQLADFIGLGQRAMRSVERLPLPVIAVIQGFALGGGLELALAADIIIAAEQSKLGQPEVNLGLIPGFGGTQRLSARTGIGVAKRLIFTGETIGGSDAAALGLVDYAVPLERLEEKVQSVCASLTTKSPLALAAAKRAIDARFADHKLAGLAVEVEEFLQLFQSSDAGEGLGAFLEKRSPAFNGRRRG